jgi:hypothetical protein
VSFTQIQFWLRRRLGITTPCDVVPEFISVQVARRVADRSLCTVGADEKAFCHSPSPHSLSCW